MARSTALEGETSYLIKKGPTEKSSQTYIYESDPSEDFPWISSASEMRPTVSSTDSRRKQWLTLLSGQILAILTALQNAASFSLEQSRNLVFPMFLLSFTYISLAALHLPVCSRCTDANGDAAEQNEASHKLPFTRIRLRAPWWVYFFVSVLDIGPNYLAILSLRFTSITSATLLGSLTVPSTMVFCYYLLGKRYQFQHYAGTLLCMIGGLLTIHMDLGLSDENDGIQDDGEFYNVHFPHAFLGDALAVAAALAYGLGDAVSEYCMKNIDRSEYLGSLGFFGFCFSLILAPLLECDAIMSLFASESGWTRVTTMGILIGYVASLIIYYHLFTLFLQSYDATLLNLSLQSSNVWAIVVSIIFYAKMPTYSFYVSALLVATGVFIYEMRDKERSAEEVEEQTSGKNLTDEESSILDGYPCHLGA